MNLQRYRINNCAEIADDNGGYCISEDVKKLEAELVTLKSTLKGVESLLHSDGFEWEEGSYGKFSKWVLMMEVEGGVRIKNELFEYKPICLIGNKAVKLTIEY